MSAASEVTLQELFRQVCVTKPFLSGKARGQQYFLVLRRSKDIRYITHSHENIMKRVYFLVMHIYKSQAVNNNNVSKTENVCKQQWGMLALS